MKRILGFVGLYLWALVSHAVDLGERPVFASADANDIKLGQLLFYDPILSGNRNISCATCHHPSLGTADGVSLSLGEGAVGLGKNRSLDDNNQPEQRIPQNAPSLWNIGASEFTVMFHDGRLEQDSAYAGGIRTPLGQEMVTGFDDVLSAQSMFPVLSADEMAGHYSENEIATAVRLGQLTTEDGAWHRIVRRVTDIAEYRQLLTQSGLDYKTLQFADIANLIADFIRFEWRADNSPFDQAMMDNQPLPADAAAGMSLFYGKAQCVDCHKGWLQTDHQFHSIAMPQFGPGKAARFERHQRDVGRMRVTGEAQDSYQFRTPSLRNIALTAPYGHSDSYATLEGIIKHHLDPVVSLRNYSREQALLLPLPGARDWEILDNDSEVEAIAASNNLPPMTLSQTEIKQLVAFLHALTDKEAALGRLGVPARVPSGLPVDQ